MPSPIAHSVSGYALSRLFPSDRAAVLWPQKAIPKTLFAIFVALAADLDFVPQFITGHRYHHGLTHSVTFALAFSVALWGLFYLLTDLATGRFFLLILSLYSSHLILDLFTQGGPGIQLLWPFSFDYFHAPITIFPETHHSQPLFQHPGHLVFVAFELGYTLLLLSGLWTWNHLITSE